MTVIFTTTGGSEDLISLIAFADELRRHGIDGQFAVQAHLVPVAQAHGFPTTQLGPSALGELYRAAAPFLQSGQPAAEVDRYAEAMLAAAPEAFQALSALSARASGLISSILMPLGRIVHELTGVPFAAVQLHNPSERIPSDPGVTNLREQLGLSPGAEPAPRGISPMHGYSSELTLVAVSPTVLRVLVDGPMDWPANCHAPGFFLAPEADEQPDPELAAFLSQGDPPVVFALGERGVDRRDAVISVYRAAAEAVGVRAVFRDPWAPTAHRERSAMTVAVGAEVPESWLYRRAACVVHDSDGVAVAATTRAGVPTVPVPSDPSLAGWARASQAVGAAKQVVPARELSVERMTAALETTLGDDELARRAGALREEILHDPGVSGAAKLVEGLLR